VTTKALNKVVAGLAKNTDAGSPEANGVSSAGGKKITQGTKRKAKSQVIESTVKRKMTATSKNKSKSKGDVGEWLSDDEVLDGLYRTHHDQ
jgi:hypothetical protein